MLHLHIDISRHTRAAIFCLTILVLWLDSGFRLRRNLDDTLLGPAKRLSLDQSFTDSCMDLRLLYTTATIRSRSRTRNPWCTGQ
jgi:hypothetical protein